MDRTNLNKSAADCLNEIYDDGTLATMLPSGAPTFADGTAPVGAVPAATAALGVTVEEFGVGNYRTTKFTLSSVTVAGEDAEGTIGHATLQLYTFPLGYIYTQSAVADFTATGSSAGIDDAAEGDFGLGTATNGGDADLTTTEDDILPKTEANCGASDKIFPIIGVSTAAEHVVFDGTSSAKELHWNLIIDDDNHDIAGTAANLVLSGYIIINWIYMGDV